MLSVISEKRMMGEIRKMVESLLPRANPNASAFSYFRAEPLRSVDKDRTRSSCLRGVTLIFLGRCPNFHGFK